MKRVCFFIAMLFLCFHSKGQENNQLNEMLYSSINSYIGRMNGFVERGISLRDTCLYYVCNDGLPANFPFDRIQNVVFFSLHNLNGLPKVFQKKLNNGIDVCFVWIKLTNNQIIIHISDRSVKLINRKNMSIIVRDWCLFTYEYSCEDNKWILAEIKYGGV